VTQAQTNSAGPVGEEVGATVHCTQLGALDKFHDWVACGAIRSVYDE
jgi:hypothetical protein